MSRNIATEPVSELKRIFERIDLEKNGSLNFNEFYFFLQINNPTISQMQADVLFQLIDENRSGKVIWEEFLAASRNPKLELVHILRGGRPTKSLFNLLRTNSSGIGIQRTGSTRSNHALNESFHPEYRSLTAQEIRSALELYEKLDSNRDRTVSMAEFHQAFKTVDPNYPKSDIERLFLMMDTDHTGGISVDEFLSGISQGLFNPSLFVKLVGTPTGFAWEISDELDINGKILENTAGDLFSSSWRGAKVVTKIFNSTIDLRNDKEFVEEMHILTNMRHPNLMSIMGGTFMTHNFALVVEWCDGGSLAEVLTSKRLTSDTYLKIITGIALGLNYLHRRTPKIIHKDLRPENIILDKNFTPKLAYFGLSSLLRASKKTQNSFGSPMYRAPEMWQKKNFDEKVDVYSFAIIMFQCTFYKHPFGEKKDDETYYEAAISKERPPIPRAIHPIISTVISRSWDSDPLNRPAMDRISVELGKLLNV